MEVTTHEPDCVSGRIRILLPYHTFPVFGKTFVLDKKVKKVRLYATAYGVYEVAELLGAAPQAKPLYDAVVNALNAKCKNNK